MHIIFQAALCLVLAHECVAHIYEINVDDSLQVAIDSAMFGDTVLLGDGLYNETVIIRDKEITLGSYWLLDGDTCHIHSTIVEPSFDRLDSESCFILIDNDSGFVRIAGLTIQNGQGTFWRYRNVEYESAGGGILAIESDLHIDHCQITQCHAQIGGGVHCSSLRTDHLRQCYMTYTMIEQCLSESFGGGVYLLQVIGQISNTTMRHNQALFDGGAVVCLSGELNVISCFVDSNYSGFGAVSFVGGIVSIAETEFAHNACVEGGVCDLIIAHARARITQSIFRDNDSPSHSIVLDQVQDDGVFFEQNQVLRCGATMHNGVIVSSASHISFVRNLFMDNLNGSGGLFTIIGLNESYIRIRHNIILNTRALHPAYGSVLFDQTYQRSIMDSNYIAGNGSPVVSGIGQNHIPFYCLNNWWGHESGPYHAELNPTGQGDTLVGDDCEFIPWLTSPPDTTGWLPAIERPRIPISKTWELVNVFPNPFNSSVMIAFSGITGTDFEISIHNLLGQKVDTITHGALTGTVINYTAPRELSSGVYFLVARDRVNIETKKVVLLR